VLFARKVWYVRLANQSVLGYEAMRSIVLFALYITSDTMLIELPAANIEWAMGGTVIITWEEDIDLFHMLEVNHIAVIVRVGLGILFGVR
jgi:hypothetical protein